MNVLNACRGNADSTMPSLTLLLALDSPLSSPRMASAELKCTTPESNLSQKKRRQRLGPSCDSCRARKVKCNADVIMLSREYNTEEEVWSLLPEARDRLVSGAAVSVGDYTLVLSNSKLFKFRACQLCAGKGIGCCFSKGFTKEDIVHSKRSGEVVPVVEKKPVAQKVVKRRSVESVGTRKSSCVACRKRKVKCVMNGRVNKCVGCIKKDHTCSFEVC